MDKFRVHSSNTQISKRKRAANVIISDDESSYDDNALTCTLKTRHTSRGMTDSESGYSTYGGARIRMRTNEEDANTTDEHMDEFRVHSSSTRSAKRKLAANIIISDDEGSYDDNSPIRTLKTQHTSRVMTNSDEELEENVANENEVDNAVVDEESEALLNEYEADASRDANYTNEEHMIDRVHSSNTRAGKRKRAANIILSEDESSYDDNAPICTLKTQHPSRVMTDSDEEVKENVTNEYKADNAVVDECESECESLDGFIDHSSESVSVCDSENGDDNDNSEDVFSVYRVILEKISRKKILNPKWENETHMRSNFGKDPDLCMSAVCALYRRQTDDEKASTETRHRNNRGFSQPHAPGGSKLAEFLMDGDSNGDVNRTVEELNEYYSGGSDRCDRCRELALHYSTQLFDIYQNKEDPYFPPRR